MKYNCLTIENGDVVGFSKRFTSPRAKLWLTTDKHELPLGEEFKGTVGVSSEEEFDIKEIVVELRCRERIKKIRRYYKTDGETGEKEWREEEYDHYETLYSKHLQICSGIHVNVGFNKEFPFVFKIPASERETYQSVDKKVEWLVSAFMEITGRSSIVTQEYEAY